MVKNQVNLKTIMIFFDCPRSPRKRFPNVPIFNDFTACYVCVAVQPIWKAVHEGLNVLFPKAAWRQRYGREEK